MTQLPILRAHNPLRRRTAELRNCSVIALALGLAALPAAALAQSFQGAPTTVLGTATVSSVAGGTLVEVNQPETVINWSVPALPSAVPINFQAAGTTALFRESDSFGSNITFTVLNRILPVDAVTGAALSRAVQFNGAVQATLFGQAANANVWFYSPTGIVAGPTATFNVGSLLLTTNNIDTTGGTLFGPSGEIRFRGPANSTGFINIQPGAQLNANDPNGSYLALVAPRVVQSGTLQSNGHIGLVAAEQADITISTSTFDIRVTQGTTDANGIVHTGTSGGPASTSAADLQFLQMVAIPKNTVMTMLLSGSVGYTPAASATDDGSSITLSAGFAPFTTVTTPTQGQGYLTFDNGVFTNPVTAAANHTITLSPTAGTIDFQANASFTAGIALNAIAEEAEAITGAGDLSFNAIRPNLGGGVLLQALGTGVSLPRGQIAATGILSVRVDGQADKDPPGATGFDASGGQATLNAAGGIISGNDISVIAFGRGQNGLVDGGNGDGGDIRVLASGGGSITSGTFTADARGTGGSGPTSGGNGFGGTIDITETGGALALGVVDLNSTGSGGSSDGQAGDGIGGAIAIDIAGQTQTWSSLFANVSAFGGSPNSISIGFAGNATGDINGISLTVRGTGKLITDSVIALTADANTPVNGNVGQTGTAGNISVNVANGGELTVNSTFFLDANAQIDTSRFVSSPLRAPRNDGGTIDISAANGGTITVDGLRVNALAFGAGSDNGSGAATGGSIIVSSINGGNIGVTGNIGSPVFLNAGAIGALGPSAADATGGRVEVFASDGTISFIPQTFISSLAIGDDSEGSFNHPARSGGFNAQGGTALLELRSGTTGTGEMLFSNVTVDASGLSLGPVSANGGAGLGGNASVNIAAGNFDAGTLIIRANGTGAYSGASPGPSAYVSGDGFGGGASYTQTGGTGRAINLTISAEGRGGRPLGAAVGGDLPALGGDGFGGFARFEMSGGFLLSDSMAISAQGIGGTGMNNNDTSPGSVGGDGGDGFGGDALLFMPLGSSSDLTGAVGNDFDGSVLVNASGLGGSGGLGNATPQGNGGVGQGNTAAIQINGGGFQLKATTVTASGQGGGGTIGGDGFGGSADFTLNDPGTGNTGLRTLVSLNLSGSGIAGEGSGPPAGATAGSTSLTANVGAVNAAMRVKNNFSARALGTTAPAGSGFSANVSGDTLLVSGNTLIDTARDVTLSAGPATPFFTSGTLTIDTPRTVTMTSGQMTAGGNTSIIAALGIDMTGLASGGTTLLRALNGTVRVSSSLASTGLVTVLGQAVDLRSFGALSFAAADATGTSLSIRTGGNLDVTSVSAINDITLVSSVSGLGGNLHATGNVVGGNITLGGLGDVLLDSLVQSGGTLTANAGGSFTSTAGNLSAAGNVSITAAGGITAPSLRSGGTTLLSAASGLVSIGTDLDSAGLVSLLAQAANIVSTHPLSFSSASATVGGLSVSAIGNLVFTDVSAVGALDLSTTVGSLSATGTVDGGTISLNAPNFVQIGGDMTSGGTLSVQTGGSFVHTAAINTGGNTSIIAPLGIDLAQLASGGTTLLRAITGDVLVSGNLTSTGLVTAFGRSVDLTSLGGLSFADLDAVGGATGNIRVQTTGDLSVNTVTATRAISLASSGGALQISGLVGGNAITLGAGGAINSTAGLNTSGALSVLAGTTFTSAGSVVAGTNIGDTSIIAPLGITMDQLDSGGTTLLQAVNGPVEVTTNLLSAGLVTALGTSIDITSLGTLDFAALDATAGNLRVITAGDLTLGTIDVTGSVTLGSTAGAIQTTGLVSGNGVRLTAAGNVQTDLAVLSGAALDVLAGGSLLAGGALTAAGAVSLDANGGITAPSVTSGGTTLLRAAGGNLSIATNLTSPGLVTVLARNINIRSAGALAFADADATAGNMTLRTGGNLDLSTADATGAVILISDTGAIRTTGAVNTSSAVLNAASSIRIDSGLASTGGLQATAGTSFLSAGTVSSVGNMRIIADSGITADQLSSGGTTLLQAANGPLEVTTNLLSAGLVTALGTSIDITSLGALDFTSLDATTGNLRVITAGTLNLGTIDVAGSVTLGSTGGTIRTTGPVSGNGISLTAAIDVVTDTGLTSLAGIQISAGDVYTAGGTLDAAGNIGIDAASGIDAGIIDAGGTLTLGSIAGGIGLTGLASGNGVSLTASGIVSAGSGITSLAGIQVSTSGSFIGGGSVSAAGDVSIDATLGNFASTVDSGGTTLLRATGGSISVTSLSSVGAVTALGQQVSLFSTGPLSFADADATAGGLLVEAAGNLSLASADATGQLSLTTSAGSLTTTGAISGSNVVLNAPAAIQLGGNVNASGIFTAQAGTTFTAPVAITAGGFASVTAPQGISIDSLSSGGTTLLQALNGPLLVSTSLLSTGLVTAQARSVDITSTGTLAFAAADATAGNLRIITAGNLDLGTIDVTGSVTLGSTGGTLRTNGAVNGNGITFTAAGNIQTVSTVTSGAGLQVTSGGSYNAGGAVSATGNVSIAADLGISASSLTSGGTTMLQALNGSLQVLNLASSGLVTARARLVDIRSTGALAFGDIDATNGLLFVFVAGNLDVATADATQYLTLQSTGGTLNVTGAVNGGAEVALLADGTITAGGDITSGLETIIQSTTGSFTAGGAIDAGGMLEISTSSGINAGTVSSGGTTLLQAGTGGLSITDLLSSGLVSAFGEGVSITSSGTLAFAALDSGGGDLAITTAGNLDLPGATALGSVALTSTGGAVTMTGTVSGTGVTLSASGDVATAAIVSSAGLGVTAGGAFATTGALSAAGPVTITADGGIGAGALTSGGTTQLTASGGSIAVTELISSGLVAAEGTSVLLLSSGGLAFSDLAATAGNLTVGTGGNLQLAGANATGALSLTSSTGTLTTSGGIGGSSIQLGASGPIMLGGDANTATTFTAITGGSFTANTSILAGGAVSITGSGITLGQLGSGGTTLLDASSGALLASSLSSAGPVTARGTSVDITSPGTLAFADADATAGNLRIITAGNLDLATIDVTGTVTLGSTAGALRTTGAVSGNGINFSAAGNVRNDAAVTSLAGLQVTAGGAYSAGGTVSASSNVNIAADLGITAATLISGGTTTLRATGGAVGVTALTSPGAVTVLGRSVSLASPGALTFTDADATAGGLAISTGGNLTVASVDATQAVQLATTGGNLNASGAINGNNIALNASGLIAANGNIAAGGTFTAQAGSTFSAPGSITTGENASIIAPTGITIGSLASGGTTLLRANNGTTRVSTNLTSAGLVTARGTEILINSLGALSFADLDATAAGTFGNARVVTTGDLNVATVDATGSVFLISNTGAINASGAINGNFVNLDASGSISTVAAVSSNSLLRAVSATGEFTAAAPLAAAGDVILSADGGISAGTLQSGGDTRLEAFGGAVVVTDLASTGLITMTGRSLDITSAGALSFADSSATNGDFRVNAGGDLVFDAISASGAAELTTSAGSLTTNGAVNAGSVLLSAPDFISLNAGLVSGGTFTAQTGGAFTANAPLAVQGDTSIIAPLGITIGSLQSGGATLLQALNGSLTISGSLFTTGLVTAQARSIDITSTDALGFADIDASAGDLRLVTDGDLDLGTIDVSGRVAINARSGSVRLDGAVQGGAITISGLGNLEGTAPITSASFVSLDMVGAVNVSGNITAQSDIVVASGADISLADVRTLGSIPSADPDANLILLAGGGSLSAGSIQTPGRLIAIADAGSVTAATIDAAQGIDIITTGDVDLADVTSAGRFLVGYDSSLYPLITAGIFTPTLLTGAVPQRTSGLLSVAGQIDAGSVTTVIDGPVSGAGITSAGNLLIDTTGNLSFASVSSTTGNLRLIGAQGIDVGSMQSGGTTLLRASGGAISVASLTSPGLVTLSGQSADITSPGALAFADADATAGDLVITANGNLDLTTADATGLLRLDSTGGALRATGAVNGGDVALLAVGTLQTDAPVSAGGSLFAQSGGDMTAGADWQAGTSLSIRAGRALTAQALRSDGSIDLSAQRAATTGVLVAGTSLQANSLAGFTSGAASAGDWLEITAAGNITTGNLSAGTDLGVATQGNRLAVGNVAAGDDIFLSAFASNLTTLVTAGNVVSSGAGSDTAITLPSIFGDAGPTGNVTRIRSGGGLNVGNVTTPGRAILVADRASIDAGTSSGGEAVLAFARGDVRLGAVTTGGKFYVADAAMFVPNLPDAYDPASLNGLTPVRTSGGLALSGPVEAGEISVTVLGNVTGSSLTAATSTLIDTSRSAVVDGITSGGGGVQVIAPLGIDIGTLASAGNVGLLALNGSISSRLSVLGDITARGLSVSLTGSGGLVSIVDGLASDGDFTLDANGDISAASISASGQVALRNSGELLAVNGPVSGVTVLLANSGGNVLVNGPVTASGQLDIEARGGLTVAAPVIGSQITVFSQDIAITDQGRIGSRGVTGEITLNSIDPSRTTFIGDATNPSGYHLSNSEAQRLFADESITIVARPFDQFGLTGPSNMTIGTLSLSFGAQGNIGSGGTLKVFSPGNILINGAVQLTTSSADDTFSIDPVRIDIEADTGSIIMRNSAGALNGRLELIADTVTAVTRSTLSSVNAATSLTEITRLLGVPGPESDGGYIQAGDLFVSVSNGFFVQNSGVSIAFPSRRGFSANRLNIETEGANTSISINGQLFNPDGLAITGLQTARDVLINGSAAISPVGEFTLFSAINGCGIGQNCQSNSDTSPSSDDTEGKVEPSETPPQVLAVIAIEEFETENLMPIVDEPVTGVGNDDLWQEGCVADSAGCSITGE